MLRLKLMQFSDKGSCSFKFNFHTVIENVRVFNSYQEHF